MPDIYFGSGKRMGKKANSSKDLGKKSAVPGTKSARKVIESVSEEMMIHKLPSYANSFFYSLGFLMLVCFVILVITGMVMLFFGQAWWQLAPLGIFTRSVHLWAAMAFAFFLVLHAFVGFSTSAFKSTRKLLWVIGSILLFIVLVQIEFGYGLRGDFSSQYRALAGADFWNGAGLGAWFNVLNYGQLLSVHTVIIPIILIAIIALHYSIVKKLGIAKPYRKDVYYKMVPADHISMGVRAVAVIAIILFLARTVPSPYIPPVTIQQIAASNPRVIATTLMSELNGTSGTATYMDNIDPYTFNTAQIYVITPYLEYVNMTLVKNSYALFSAENASTQAKNMNKASAYFAHNGTLNYTNNTDPVIAMVSAVMLEAKGGVYDYYLEHVSPAVNDETYELRFLSDTGYLDEEAAQTGINLTEYGMVKDEEGAGLLPLNSWWMLPYNIIDNTIWANNPNQDSDGAILLLLVWLVFVAVPWIPFVNELPDKLGLYRLFWRERPGHEHYPKDWGRLFRKKRK